MLLVHASAGPSNIHGIGLIAREEIPAGTRVWELRPEFDRILTLADVERFSAEARRQIQWYAFFDVRRQAYILSSDDDRFTNHSDDPNTRGTGGVILFTVAARTIRCGEEITWNYQECEYHGEFPTPSILTPES